MYLRVQINVKFRRRIRVWVIIVRFKRMNRGEHSQLEHCKSWTVDSGLDCAVNWTKTGIWTEFWTEAVW